MLTRSFDRNQYSLNFLLQFIQKYSKKIPEIRMLLIVFFDKDNINIGNYPVEDFLRLSNDSFIKKNYDSFHLNCSKLIYHKILENFAPNERGNLRSFLEVITVHESLETKQSSVRICNC